MAGPLDTNRFKGNLGDAALLPEKTLGPPITGTHEAGEEHYDSYGGQWLCVGSGTPGNWIRINEPPGSTTGADYERTITTGEAIVKFQIVTDSGFRFDAKNQAHMRIFVGMASHNQASVGAPLIVWTPGSEIANPAWSWTPHKPLYANPAVPGGLTHTPPDGGALWGEGRLQVGIAYATDTITLVEREPLWFPDVTPPP